MSKSTCDFNSYLLDDSEFDELNELFSIYEEKLNGTNHVVQFQIFKIKNTHTDLQKVKTHSPSYQGFWADIGLQALSDIYNSSVDPNSTELEIQKALLAIQNKINPSVSDLSIDIFINRFPLPKDLKWILDSTLLIAPRTEQWSLLLVINWSD